MPQEKSSFALGSCAEDLKPAPVECRTSHFRANPLFPLSKPGCSENLIEQISSAVTKKMQPPELCVPAQSLRSTCEHCRRRRHPCSLLVC
jgi:hypothetical protein